MCLPVRTRSADPRQPGAESSVTEFRHSVDSPFVYEISCGEDAAFRHPSGTCTELLSGPSRKAPSTGSAGAANIPIETVPSRAPVAAASLRAAASPGHCRGVRNSPHAAPASSPPPCPQLSTPAEPSPARNSANSQGKSRRPKCARSRPRTARRQPRVADAPSTPKAIPEAPSEIESAPTAEATVVPSAVKMINAR